MLKKCDYEEINIKTYQYFIDKLIYLSCKTGSDIAFAIEQLSK